MIDKSRIAVFDLDGTLIDSMAQITFCLEKACIEILGKPISHSTVFKTLGLPLTSILQELGIPDENILDVTDLFRTYLKIEIGNGNKVFSGALSTIMLLISKNYQIAIATTKPTRLAELVVENSDLSGSINLVQGTEDFPPKPDPEILFRIEKKLSGRIQMMFGDRIEDIQAAKSASVVAIGVAQGAHSADVLMECGADYAYESFEELIDSNILINLF